MTTQIRKTYRGINPEMLYDEMRGLAQKQGLAVDEVKQQTYSLPSGSTQSRVTLKFKTQGEKAEDEKTCGDAHIMSSPGGETKMLLDLDEDSLSQERISAFQQDLDFILGSYEVKW
jgi:hypothetical protein